MSSSRIRASGSSALCGVELIRPNAACAIARALSGRKPAVHLAEPPGPEVDVLPLQAAHLLARVVGQRLPVAVLDDDERPVPQREVDVPLDQRHQGGPRVGRGLGPLATDLEEPLADRDQHLGEHGVLGGEVLVERRPGDPARRADVGDADPVEAARREQLRRGREDLLASRELSVAMRPRLAVANYAAVG